MRKRILSFPAALVLLFSPFSNGLAASFNCSKASTNVEKMICRSNSLTTLDENLSEVYREAKDASQGDKGKLKNLLDAQRYWIRNSRDICKNEECLKKAYSDRIAALNKHEGEKLKIKPATPSSPVVPSLESNSEVLKSGKSVGWLKAGGVHELVGSRAQTDNWATFFNGRLIFSQYDENGNNSDVVSFDPDTLSAEYLIRGRPGAKFITMNDRYLVIEEGTAERGFPRVVVIDRASGKRLKELRLSKPILGAAITGDQLVSTQEGETLVFSLPDLKVRKDAKLSGGLQIKKWRDQYVSLGDRLIVLHDRDLNEIETIHLPVGTPSNCRPNPADFRVYQDYAVVEGKCGTIYIYNLRSKKLEHVIPSYTQFIALEVADGLIFTVPESQKDKAHVFDLYSAKELAIIPMNATKLFAKGDELLAIQEGFAKPLRFTVFKMNFEALRK